MLTGGRALRVYEAAFVLRISENEIQRQMSRGELAAMWAVAHQRVASAYIRTLIADDPLADLALEQILEGRLRAPRAKRPSQTPPPLSTIARSLR